ncbi:MAG: ABC transporter permease [Spirochaetales bacterium]|nr:ABC transporter permease [Spirochaetales bacterium]
MRGRVLARLTGSLLLQEIRSFQSLFWMLLFPVFLLVLFGLIFGQEGFRRGSLVVGVDETLRDVPGLDLRWMPEERKDEVSFLWLEKEAGLEALEEGSVYAFITRDPAEEEYTVIITERYRQFTMFITSVMDRIQADTFRTLFRRKSIFPYTVRILERSGRSFSYISYLLSGIVGISLMLNFFFTVPQTVISYRSRGFLKRLSHTPLSKGEFLTSLIGVRGIIAVLQVAVLALCAALFFHARFYVRPFPFIVVFLAGTASFGAVGFFLAGVLDTMDASAAVAQILNMLFMFTAGIFFPLEIMPAYFTVIARFNPVYYLSRAVMSTLFLGRGFGHVAGDLLVLGGIFVVFLVLTLVTFRFNRKT